MFALIFAFATLLADAIPTPAPQPSAPDPVPLQSVERKMTVDGIERTYFVYRPAKLPSGAHPPLVIAMHGGGSIAQGVETHYFWIGKPITAALWPSTRKPSIAFGALGIPIRPTT
jgi:acetyl esterase/lipase